MQHETDGPDTRGGLGARDRGAALVEFAVVAPLLFLVTFAIIEFGWLFGQHEEVRHSTGEGARMVAINFASEEVDQTAAIVDAICDTVAIGDTGDVTVQLSYDGTGTAGGTNFAEARVVADYDEITGFLGAILPNRLASSISSLIEVDATWTPGTYPC